MAGLDEVGRGCLAGPVVAAAVMLKTDSGITNLVDSKSISESKRNTLSEEIHKTHWVGIGSASPQEIDEINILQASLLAMKRALEELEKKVGQPMECLLIDGTFKIPHLDRRQITLIKGDSRCAPISAASIVAKVYRDQWMQQLDREFPLYGFKKHKGYPSPIHKKVIQEQGPCLWHRKSFSGVREYIS